MNNYVIYAHISPSGKVYIGQTCRKPEKRWGKEGNGYLKKKKDGSYIHLVLANAILKWGWNSFEHKILFTGLSKLDADLIEQDLIYYYKSKGMSYNITDGGAGCAIKRLSEDELKEHRRQYYKKWCEENKEELKAYKREYAKQHREEYRAYNKKWYNNLAPEKKKAMFERDVENSRKRRLLKQNNI